MKTVIIGIDGLGTQSLNAFNLVRLKKRMQESKFDNPKIDNIVSRGWAEIYTGMSAYETGAFYQIPVKNGKRIRPSQDTGVSRVIKHTGGPQLLWNQLNSLGLSCGVYTVPSVTSSQELNGFFVTATGGGRFENALNEDDFFPSRIITNINSDNFNLGFRMGYGSYLPQNVSELEVWIRTHIDQYFDFLTRTIDLVPVDTIFASSRFLTLAYKFIGLMVSDTECEHSSDLKSMLLSVADLFDEKLDQFINACNANNLFVVSDHGVGLYEYDVNINELLVNVGELKPSYLKNLVKEGVNLKRIITSSKRPPLYPGYDLVNSKSFSIGYTDLVYLNDERFFGENTSGDQVIDVSNAIIEKLNRYVLENGLHQFKGFESISLGKYTNAQNDDNYKVALPNIRCHLSEGCANLGRSFRHISRKKEYSFDKEIFKEGFFAEYSGCKTQDTIAFYQGANFDKVKLNSLTDIYDSVLGVSSI